MSPERRKSSKGKSHQDIESALFKNVFRSMREPAFITDADSNVLECNKAACDHLKREKSTVLGQNLCAISHAEHTDSCQCLEENEVSTGEVESAELFLDKRHIIVSDALHRNRRLLNEVHRISKFGAWEYDIDEKRMTWTDEVYKIHDVSPEKYDPNDIQQDILFYAPEDRKKIENAFKSAVEKGEPFDLELEFTSATGKEKCIRTMGEPVFVNDEITKVIGNIMDITRQKRLAQDLKRSDERFRRLSESVNAIIWEFDMVQGKWTYVSPQAADMTGWPPDDWTDMQFWADHIHPDDRELASEYCAACTSRGESHEIEYRFLRPDDTFLWIKDVISVEMKLGKPVRLHGLMIDVTRQKEAEQALELHLRVGSCIAEISSEFVHIASGSVYEKIDWALEKMGKVAGADRCYIFLLDRDTSIGDNTHEWCADGIEPQMDNLQGIRFSEFPWTMERLQNFEKVHVPRVSDLPPEASPEKHISEIQDIKSVLMVPMVWQEVLRGFIGFDSVTRERSWTKEEMMLLDTLADVFISAIERKRSEEELQESEAFIKTVLDNLPIGIAVNSFDSVEFHYMNDNFPRIYRTTREYLANPDNFLDAVYTDEGLREELKKRVIEDCKSGDPKRMLWTDVPLTRDGEETTYITARNIPVPGRSLMISTVWDVTDRKRVEEDLYSSLQEKDVLMREVHHRVKNNMQIISSLLRLQADQEEDKRLVQGFMEAESRIKSMALVHEKLYNAEGLANIDVASYVRDLASHLFRAYGISDSNISLDIESEDVHLGVDEAIPIGLILNELISNSLKHAFHNGKGNITVEFRKEDGGLIMEVADNGCGIPSDVSPSRTSTLGLSVVHSLSKQMGGEMKLERENGTRFIFTFDKKHISMEE